jgi:RNA polymerase sigma-B factor
MTASTTVESRPRSVARDREELLRSNYGLAVSLARRFAMRAGWGESLEDLVQVALVGLVNAIDRFDAGKGVPFAGFASATIVGELKHHLRDRAWAIRPPRRMQELYLEVQTAGDELSQELGHPPTLEDIACRVDATERQVMEAMEVANLRRPASLDAQPSGEDDRSPVVRLPVRDLGYDAVDQQLSVARLLAQLPERQRRMVRLRFIDGLTQNEIAERMSMSQAHVQRLLVRSMDQLRALAAAS